MDDLRRQNGRLADEKSEKDHLLKELTSKNLELLAKIATLESSVKPLNEDLKFQIAELKIQLEKSESSRSQYLQ